MKFRISLIFLLITLCFCCKAVQAEDSLDDWGGLIKDYNGSNNFGRIISDQEYKKAVETKESYIKKAKKKKKKSKEETEFQSETKAVFEAPDSPNPLLILPADFYYENKIIKQGFYLINSKCNGGRYFLEFMQANNKPIAIIEAKKLAVPIKNILNPQVSIENIDDKTIKVNYNGNNLILESVLWKY